MTTATTLAIKNDDIDNDDDDDDGDDEVDNTCHSCSQCFLPRFHRQSDDHQRHLRGVREHAH